MALSDGFQLQFELGALFCLAGALMAAVLLRLRRASPVGEGALEAERA